MADWSGMVSKSRGFDGGNEDFEEEDVWGFVKERENSSPKMMKKSNKDYLSSALSSSSSSSASAWRLPTAPRIIPRANNTPTTTHEAAKVVQKSAPVNIPDWSKIYGKTAKINGSWVNHGDGDEEDDGDGAGAGAGDYGDDEDDDGDDMIPPHEWVARKLARSQISSFSVCEGIGRTLKGRDLSKVRNAILTRTGFLE